MAGVRIGRVGHRQRSARAVTDPTRRASCPRRAGNTARPAVAPGRPGRSAHASIAQLMAADVRHRVEGARAAVRLAARPLDRAGRPGPAPARSSSSSRGPTPAATSTCPGPESADARRARRLRSSSTRLCGLALRRLASTQPRRSGADDDVVELVGVILSGNGPPGGGQRAEHQRGLLQELTTGGHRNNFTESILGGVRRRAAGQNCLEQILYCLILLCLA